MSDQLYRCQWANSNGREKAYHDHEWGVPLHDDRALFELLCLEGAQAGLSWDTILAKRDGYREVFYNFSIDECARMSDDMLEERLQDPRIVRNRHKVYGVRKNARAAQQVQKEHGSLREYLWSFVDHTPVKHAWLSSQDVPAFTEKSVEMSNALKKAGFTFVGPTICYAFMQSSGMVNDHVVDCFRYDVT